MKYFILIMACLTTVTLFGQVKKNKTFEVVKIVNVDISGTVYYEDNIVTDTLYFMFGRDARYSSIVELIVLESGRLNELEILVKNCIQALSEDDGTSLTYGENTVYVNKIMGVKSITLYGQGDDDSGYVYLSKQQLNKLLAKIEEHKIKIQGK